MGRAGNLTNTTAAAASERLHGLDAVRGYALLLGVIYHATMAYLPGPQIWPVKDSQESLILSGLFFVSHTFRMTTFFLIAGFFAHMMVEKRGVAGFVRDRAKRIALPLVAFWPISIGGILAAAAYGAYVATGHVPTHGPPPAPNPPPLAFPLTHLWFLYLLLWLYAGALAARGLVLTFDRKGALPKLADRLVRWTIGNPLGTVVLGLPAFTAFALSPQWLPWFGVTTPDQSLIPNAIALTQFGMAFGFGWLLNRQAGLLQGLAQRWPTHLGLAVLFTAAQLAWMGVHPMLHPATSDLQRIGLGAYYAMSAWTGTFAIIGLAVRFLSNESPARRYIADSSYWVYLVHLPIVMALQAAVSRLGWPWEVKFAVVLGVGFVLMFASYQLLVRRTWIGAILNGRRAPKPVRAAPILQPEAAR